MLDKFSHRQRIAIAIGGLTLSIAFALAKGPVAYNDFLAENDLRRQQSSCKAAPDRQRHCLQAAFRDYSQRVASTDTTRTVCNFALASLIPFTAYSLYRLHPAPPARFRAKSISVIKGRENNPDSQF